MPQQLPLNYQPAQGTNGNNSYGSSQQPTYNNYSKPQSPQKNDFYSNSNTSADFQRFYGPVTISSFFLV